MWLNVSQGSVATYAGSGEAFNKQLTANVPKNLTVKKICKSIKIWQNYGHEFVASLFGPTYSQFNNCLVL